MVRDIKSLSNGHVAPARRRQSRPRVDVLHHRGDLALAAGVQGNESGHLATARLRLAAGVAVVAVVRATTVTVTAATTAPIYQRVHRLNPKGRGGNDDSSA